MNRLWPLAFCALLAGCATSPKPAPKTTPTPDQSGQTMGSAVSQPFKDLNLTRDPIPPALVKAAVAPYEAPSPRTCEEVKRQIAGLDAVLGPDLDVAVKQANGDDIAGEVVVDALRSAATGWMPLRGVVRRISGAEEHARAFRKAILAGEVRRAYLKGQGESLGCPAPAAPVR